MEEYASQLALALSRLASVRATVTREGTLELHGGRLNRSLTDDLSTDLPELQRLDGDVVLCLNAGFAAAAPYLSRPLVVVAHGNDFLRPWIAFPSSLESVAARLPGGWRAAGHLRQNRLERQLRRGLPHCKVVVANSRSTREKIVNAYDLEPACVSVVPPGVADDFFTVRQRPTGSTLRLLTVSRLTQGARRKNVENVIRALPLVTQQRPVHYTIVGDGDDRLRLTQLARNCGVSDLVTFSGSVSRSQLLHHYGDADLFVLAPTSARHDVEGFGIVYIESSAAGVPVLGSRMDGCVDAIDEHVNGWFAVDPTPSGIAESILDAAPRLGSAASSRARTFAEAFRWDIVAERFAEILSNACAAGGQTDVKRRATGAD